MGIFGDISVLEHGNKTITTGEGGMVVSKNNYIKNENIRTMEWTLRKILA